MDNTGAVQARVWLQRQTQQAPCPPPSLSSSIAHSGAKLIPALYHVPSARQR